ncbi:hypothetical protein BCEP4_600035 [Burkholderia cepacia]|nr:hypothetical protein BCEP4_600035 [Burkholderia cepacia]
MPASHDITKSRKTSSVTFALSHILVIFLNFVALRMPAIAQPRCVVVHSVTRHSNDAAVPAPYLTRFHAQTYAKPYAHPSKDSLLTPLLDIQRYLPNRPQSSIQLPYIDGGSRR